MVPRVCNDPGAGTEGWGRAVASGRQARFTSDCVMNPEGWGLGSSGTHVKGTQDVERGPNAQVVDGAQDERHDEGADAVALGEEGHDGEADEDPEEQRDEWGAQHSWGPRNRDRAAHSSPSTPQTPRSLPLSRSPPCKSVTWLQGSTHHTCIWRRCCYHLQLLLPTVLCLTCVCTVYRGHGPCLPP